MSAVPAGRGGPADARTWPDLLTSLLAGEDLDADRTRWVMDRIMRGEATPVQVAGFLVALRAKGLTVPELSGLVEGMLQHAVRIEVPGPTVDVVGTGGDRLHTVNVSTMAAIAVAGTGQRVVKHGNRAASSSSGAADVLEALGVRLDLPAEDVARVATEVGITFCFAQRFHPAMRHAGVARSELGIPTAFNFLGPLTNPAQPRHGAIGVADARMAPLMAGVLAARGASALVFRGEEGLDELSVAGASRVWEVRDGGVVETTLHPGDVGISVSPLSTLRGGDAAHNAAVVRAVMAGERGPVRDAVVLNAGAALASVDPSSEPLRERVRRGVATVEEALDTGRAAAVLDAWIAATSA